MKPVAEEFRERFNYDPESGELTWKARPVLAPQDKTWNARYVGTQGHRHRDGYIVVSVNRKRYLAHRVIWLIMTGHWPKDEIDHINRDRSDNRWCNLREATPSQNQKNRASKGYTYHAASKMWMVRVCHNYKQTYIGSFKTEAEAQEAAKRARLEHYGAFA